MSDLKDIELLILGHTPILQIESHEEKRALNLLVRIATSNAIPIFQWSATEGLKRLDIDLGVQRHNAAPEDVLGHIKSADKPGIYVLLDFESYIKEPMNTRFVKEIAMKFDGSRNKLVLISHKMDMPAGLVNNVVHFELSLPDQKALTQLVNEESVKWQKETGKKVSTDEKTVPRLVQNISGLTFKDAKRLIRNAIVDDGVISDEDLPEVMKAKYELLNRDDVISFEYDTARFSEVGGMRKLKSTLR